MAGNERVASATPLKALEEQANALAMALNKLDAPCTEVARSRADTGTASCLAAEEYRPLDRAERAKGWSCRPYWAYQPARMCDTCAARWHANMARLALLDAIRRDQIRDCGAPRVSGEKAVTP